MPSEKYTRAREKIAAAKAEAQSIAEVAFREEATELLDELGVESFTWQQYTPYFNDGDACVFGVYADEPKINGFDAYEAPDRVTYLWGDKLTALSTEERAEYERKYAEYSEPYRKVARFVISWETEDLLFMFGDHVEVTVSRDGIEVEDYSHD